MSAFYKAVMVDPGFLDNQLTFDEQRDVVYDLADKASLDQRHFCITCMVRKRTACITDLYAESNLCPLTDQEALAIETL
jgi:hypothetical protein